MENLRTTDYVIITLIALNLVSYISGWIGLPKKIDSIEKQLKIIADILEKNSTTR